MSETNLIKTKIYSNKLHIGTGLLKNSLGGMGEMFGEFIPNENYRLLKEEIQKLHTLRDEEYSKTWRELRFNAQLESGYFVHVIGDFDISDFEELQDETFEIHLAGVLSCVFAHLRNEEPFDSTIKIKAFLPFPWKQISIEEKIAFEDELKKEIGSTRNYIPAIFKRNKNHLLSKTQFSALAKNSENDDVVFSIHGEANGFIAVVHLIWSDKAEKDPRFPWTNLYQNLEELIEHNE